LGNKKASQEIAMLFYEKTVGLQARKLLQKKKNLTGIQYL